MKKGVIWVHRLLFAANVIMLAMSLVYFLMKWKELPAEIGIHFDRSDENGSFDVVASKAYGFYPHIIGGLIIAGIAAADHFIKNKKSGLRISEKGEELFRSELLLNLDIFLIVPCFYFAHWSYCVATQTPLNRDLLNIVLSSALLIVFIGIIVQIVTCQVYKLRDGQAKEKDVGQKHRMSRIIAWLITVGGLCTLAESWVRHPADPVLYDDPEYYGLAYAANPDTFIDKRLLLIPHILTVIVLAVIEVISVKAEKKHNDLLALFLDDLKVLCGFSFFYCDTLLDCEQAISTRAVCVFAALIVMAFITYLYKKKRVR